jgi:hypothetical protein
MRGLAEGDRDQLWSTWDSGLSGQCTETDVR